MPILIALLGIIGGAYFWMNRARNAAHMAGDLADAAQTALGAARRFGFRRQANKHPVECIEDPSLAIGSLTLAFFQLGSMPTEQQKTALLVSFQTQLRVSLTDAEEIMTLGNWFVQECQGATPAVNRLSKKVWKLQGAAGLDPTMAIIQDINDSAGSDLNAHQIEALADIKRAFHVR
ncbi:MAG: hypothetical protein V3U96_10250 [Paracoccaceae bacterium]